MRRVKVVPLSRRNLEAFKQRLNESEPDAWPKFLYRAWTIIAKELGKPDVAQTIVIDAVAAAHTCAVAFSNRTLANERNRVRQEVLSAVLKLLKPIERRAPIRCALDAAAQREFRDGHADLEVMVNFFNGCSDVARGFQGVPDAQRMMRALGEPVDEIEKTDEETQPRTRNLINHYEAMHPIDRTAVEDALRQLTRAPTENLTALDVLSAIARTLTVAAMTEPKEDGGDLLAAYVADVEKLWRRSGFRPSRVRNASKPEYHGPYHRFLELILINQLDPRSRLFEPLSEKDPEQARKIHAAHPKELKDPRIGPKYLISEHYLRKSQR
jgi:hypothetical protein